MRQARFRAPSRQRRLPPRTRTPSLDECSLHPAVPNRPLTNCSVNARPARTGPRREPATVLAALPPRAGFRRSFAPRSGEGGVARPAAVRRNGQAPLVDFCNQNTPRARPLDRPNPDSARLGDCALLSRPGGTRSLLQPLVVECFFTAPAAPLEQDHAHAGTALAGLASSGGVLPCGRAPAEVSRARDQGAFARPAPSVTIAREGGFAPTRSARTPRVASSSRRRPEKPPPRTHAQ